MRKLIAALSFLPILASSASKADLLGADLGPLIQLVAGQVTEIQKLSETVGLAKDHYQMLYDLNEGIHRTVSQIQALQEIIERAKSLDPRQVKSLSDINALLDQANLTKAQIENLIGVKFGLYNHAIEQTALQADTSFRMGQEMVFTGSKLADESRNASPGRAGQITAASSSASMLAQGVQLQSMSHLLQLQALTLELQKGILQKDYENEKKQRQLFERQLEFQSKSKRVMK